MKRSYSSTVGPSRCPGFRAASRVPQSCTLALELFLVGIVIMLQSEFHDDGDEVWVMIIIVR
jgi:hypothetical protein